MYFSRLFLRCKILFTFYGHGSCCIGRILFMKLNDKLMFGISRKAILFLRYGFRTINSCALQVTCLKGHVGRFHVMSQQTWCSKTMKRRLCWCSKRILRKPYRFLLLQLICIDAGHVGKNALNHSIFPKSVTQAFSERKLLFKSLIEKKGSMALHVIGWNVGVLCLYAI